MKTYKDFKNYWLSSSGFLGQSFSFKTLDLEIEDNLEFLFDNFLKSLSQNVRLKISLFQNYSFKTSFNCSRASDIEKKGFLNTTGLIHFEQLNKISFRSALQINLLKKQGHLTKRLSEIHESKDSSFSNRLSFKSESPCFFNEFYHLYKPLSVSPLGLKSNRSILGVLKLKNSGNYPLSLKSLALALESVPKPLSFHISLEKMSKLKGEKILKMKSREEEEGRGQVSFEKYQKAQKAISELELLGEELFYFEVHVLLKRLYEDSLRRDLALALKALSPLGEWSLESFGAYPSLLALSPGDKLHYKLIEKSEVLKCFLPYFRFGSSVLEGKNTKEDNKNKKTKKNKEVQNPNKETLTKRKELIKKPFVSGLIYHRRDFSLDVINPFNEKYSNHTGVIIGKSGKGKSVLANLLTKALFYDNKAFIFLVDVKGSHKKTVDELGGKTYSIDIKNSSGLNPIQKLNSSKESIEITSNFIEKLLLENEEEALSSAQKNELDKSLINFVNQIESKSLKTENLENQSLKAKVLKTNDLKSLDNFYKYFKQARKEKLARFITGSLNENLFKACGDTLDNRLLYFNFENISTASNSFIAKAVMAGLMAEFSFKLLNKKPNEKLIFIADETPFFIKSCFNTFSLLSKNVRKLNGSLILLAQNSKDLVFNGDTSLIDNSEFKVLFSTDGAEKDFKQTFNLSDEEFLILKNLKTIKGLYSQFLLKDSIGSKIGFLRLSKREYVLSNTEPEFLHKLKSLQKLLSINEEKALEVMSYV